MKNIRNQRQRIGVFLCLFLIAVSLSLPNILNGIPDGHDLIYHLSRIMGTVDLLNHGVKHPIMLPGFYYNYGYPVPLFYPTGLLNSVVIMVRSGMSLVNAYTLFIFLIHLLTAGIFYLTTHRFTSNKAIRLVVTFVYCFAPYRMYTDFYTRQALGEFIAFAFIPLAFYSLLEILRYDARKWPLLTLSMIGLAYSHTLSTMAIIAYFVVFVIFNAKRLLNEKQRLLSLIYATLATLLLSASYLLPMLQMLTRDLYQFQIPWTSSELNQLTSWSEVFYLSGNSPFPYGLHLISTLVMIVGIGLYFKKLHRIIGFRFFLLAFIISLLMTSPLFPKQLLSMISFLQFPWRLFIFVTYFMSILLLLVLDNSVKSIKWAVSLVLIFALSVNYFSFTNNYYAKTEILDDLPHYAFMYAAAEFLPAKIDMRALMNRSFEQYIGTNNELEIKYERKLSEYDIWYQGNEFTDTYLEIPVLYYIGYEVLLKTDDEIQSLTPYESLNGLVQVDLPQISVGMVTIRYVGTWVQDYSRIFSTTLWILFIACLWIKRKEIVN